MKTLKKLSDKKLDQLEKRLEEKQYNLPPYKAVRMIWRIMNERLRRIGL